MHVIEGSAVVEEDGREKTFSKGDSLFIPSGVTSLWRQEEQWRSTSWFSTPQKAVTNALRHLWAAGRAQAAWYSKSGPSPAGSVVFD